MYYAFYTQPGKPVTQVVLRGLEPGKTYKVEDYYRHLSWGEFTASEETIVPIPVSDYLLLEVASIN